jgi:hypothetical protein
MTYRRSRTNADTASSGVSAPSGGHNPGVWSPAGTVVVVAGVVVAGAVVGAAVVGGSVVVEVALVDGLTVVDGVVVAPAGSVVVGEEVSSLPHAASDAPTITSIGRTL